MRKVGSWLLILASWGALAGVYFATPYVMHAHSQVVNFLQIVACGAVETFGVVMLIAGVMMRKPGAMMPRAAKVPPPKQAQPVVSAVQHLGKARAYLLAAREQRLQVPNGNSVASELWNLGLAVEELIDMVAEAMPKQEGSN